MSEEAKAKVKALFPEDVEGIYISKNDYDRLYGDLTLENIEMAKEIEKLREHTSNQDRIIAEANNRIYKAIEYIESCTWNNGIDNELQYSLHIPTLLKILKGER